MKNIKYLLFSAFAAVAIIGCQKHDLHFAPEVDASDMAEFQITYVEPIAANASNAIDSVFVNGKLVAGSTGVGQLTVNGTYPYGPSAGTGTFFTAPKGAINIQFYRKGNMVYDRTVNLQNQKYELFVYKLDQDPIILDNLYPYKGNPDRATTATFDTDSIARIRFYNFAFKGDKNTHYPGKIQYQWCHDVYTVGRTSATKPDEKWENIGDPIAFGEASDYQIIRVHKNIFNSSGYEYVWFRGIDEDGNVVIANDWWTTYIGTSVKHIYRGIKGGSPAAGVTLSGALR